MNNRDKILNILDTLIKSVDQHSDLNEIIGKAQIYGSLCWHNHVSIYRQDFWEKLISEKILKEQYSHFKYDSVTKENLHIASELYESGGHTRLLKNMLTMDTVIGDVLVTRQCDLSNIIDSTHNYKVYQTKEKTTIENIIKKCLKYKNIYLHIHPDDILSAAAVKVAKEISDNKIRIIFVNHADHCFSYGFYGADLVAEVSIFGFELSKSRRGLVNKSFFMGIALNIDNLPEIKVKNMDKKINIMSGASGSKYTPIGKNSFSAIAESILSRIPTAYIHIIGPDYHTDGAFKNLKEKYVDRFLVSSILPYDQYVLAISQADIYIDSYPMTGGTAFFEARTKGLLTTGILNSASGYTPFDACKYLEIDELVLAVNGYISDRMNSDLYKKNNNNFILENCYKCHSTVEIEHRILDALNSAGLSTAWWVNSNIDLDFYEKKWSSNGKIALDKKIIENSYINHQISSDFIRRVIPTRLLIKLYLKRILKDVGHTLDLLRKSFFDRHPVQNSDKFD